MALTFGAPVTDAQGKRAANSADERRIAHGRDLGGHLEERRISLHPEQRPHFDRAGPGDATQVVAHHVDDHQVLGALLR